MKKIKLTRTRSLIVLALFAPLAASATAPAAGGSAVVAVQSNVNGGFTLGTVGTAVSYAQNSQAATAKISAGTTAAPCYPTVTAGMTGATTSTSYGQAYNVSSGSGSGAAVSQGSTETWVQGLKSIRGVTTGFNGGASGTQSHDVIQAGTNQGSYVAGKTASGFDTQVHFERATGSTLAPVGTYGGGASAQVGLSTTNTGYANGTNSGGALEGMNAAGIANIGSSGHFFGNSRLSASTGTIVAP